ncbi:hypothetical protein MCOR02_004625 [Pyricularia oryzae]|uniref:Uncharacterized protein n=1 Tax=Pyricularia oryzae TaxID=318829 RepID=A0A4P7N0F3_PYROR|nr:hypothetical protein MCOR02_004625 [Pyricularia oryzae]KAI6307124.1 hypothetical protein MCOR34_007752 [Pyricularia oryzae]KAI6446518.1 hypothetical protein MCOR17_010744 [Pyricularia oryzae]KAI6489075.1 hypothetical protein MCOR13_008816 [Pyricularia oryzae]KAI6550878.1 hypothetical protein MCOR04_011171 [Pyricularia oryzae]
MTSDSRSAQPRSSGSGSSRNLPIHPGKQKTPAQSPTQIQNQSPHVVDPFLSDFLNPSFDPVAYLNSVLPPLQTSSSGRPSAAASARQPVGSGGGSTASKPVPLAELSSQAQAQINQLNIHTTRLAATLTQLTDDILRSGSRLAYEVELLRGETLGLAETLTEGLSQDVAKFVPGGVGSATTAAARQPPRATAATAHEDDSGQRGEGEQEDAAGPKPSDPPYIAQLRTLTLVRSRLESVIKTFGDAMEFVFPPSEVSVSSGFLSVSAPDPGKEAHSTEEKGQQVLRDLREEISGLLAVSDPKGIEDAVHRIEGLKDLNKVWHGTAEEKGRTRFLENLAKLVEDRHRELLRDLEQAKRDIERSDSVAGGGSSAKKTTTATTANASESRGYGGGYGFISQLQKIRGGL